MNVRRLLPLLSLLALAACSESPEATEEACRDEPCPAVYTPPVTLELLAPEGRTLGDVTLEGAETSCTPGGAQRVTCDVIGGAQRYVLTVRAPGYAPQRLGTTVTPAVRTASNCCSPGYVPQQLSLELVPAP